MESFKHGILKIKEGTANPMGNFRVMYKNVYVLTKNNTDIVYMNDYKTDYIDSNGNINAGTPTTSAIPYDVFINVGYDRIVARYTVGDDKAIFEWDVTLEEVAA